MGLLARCRDLKGLRVGCRVLNRVFGCNRIVQICKENLYENVEGLDNLLNIRTCFCWASS